MQELKLTEYLNGLKKLFDQYSVTKAYCLEPFDGTRTDGIVIFIDSTDSEAVYKLIPYVDSYFNSDDYVPPELRSGCLPVKGVDVSAMPCVYSNGRFYGYVN